MKKKLVQVKSASLSTDITTINGISFITTVLFGVDEQFNKIKEVVDISQFKERHTQININNYINNLKNNILKDINIISCTSDGASNNLQLNKLFKIHMICLIHSLNNLINDLLKNIPLFYDVFIRINKLARRQKMSSIEKNKLKELCETNKEKFCTVKTFSRIRFNSLSNTIESYLQMEKSLTTLYGTISDNEIEILKRVRMLFKAIEDSYSLLTNENEASFPYIFPVLTFLKKEIDEIDDSEIIVQPSEAEEKIKLTDLGDFDDPEDEGVEYQIDQTIKSKFHSYSLSEIKQCLKENFELRFNKLLKMMIF